MNTIKKCMYSLLLITTVCNTSGSKEQTESFSLKNWIKQKTINTFHTIKNNPKKTVIYSTSAVSAALLLAVGGNILRKRLSKAGTKKSHKNKSVHSTRTARPDLDAFGYTALGHELINLYTDTKKISKLLEDNPHIDVNNVDFMGNNALAWLARGYAMNESIYSEVVSLAQKLVETYDADVEKPNRSGITPLMMACRLGNTPMAQKLQDLGAQINTQTARTALIEAVNHDKIETARFLLSHGANPNLRTLSGVHPIMFATSKRMAELLAEFKADIRTATAGPEYNHQTPTQAFVSTFIKDQEKPYEQHADFRDFLAPFS